MKWMHKSVATVAAIAIVLPLAGVASAARTTTSVRLGTLDSTLLTQINVVRRANSLAPLTRSAPLAAAADAHTVEMGDAGYFAHESLDRTLFWKRIQRSYPATGSGSWSVGENLLYVTSDVDAASAVALWMTSPGHRKNVLDPTWREIGIATRHFDAAPGVYDGHETPILTTDFGRRR